MKTIRQTQGSKDCLACVAAMATNTTPDEFVSYCKSHGYDRYSDAAMCHYLVDNGLLLGACFSEDNVFGTVNLEQAFLCDVSTGLAYIAVESCNGDVRNQGASHAIYWDGEKIHDPAFEKPLPMKEYKVLTILPITKIEISGGKGTQ